MLSEHCKNPNAAGQVVWVAARQGSCGVSRSRAACSTQFSRTVRSAGQGSARLLGRVRTQCGMNRPDGPGATDEVGAAVRSDRATTRTNEIFAGSWGSWADPGNSPIWTALNTKPKYVASTRLSEPRWANATVLSGDLAAAIGELKAKPAGELQVHGSGRLVRWLFDNHLVDEIILLTYPLVIGEGTRLFPDTGQDIALDLVDSRVTRKGVTIHVYRPTGRPQYATATM